MPATFKTERQAVLPLDVSREQVIEHIQKIETILRVHPHVDHFERLSPDNLDHVLADSFFTQDNGGTDIVTYEVHERVPIIPVLGISKTIKSPVYYQTFNNGVRARLDAAWGTTLRATYVVRPLERYGAELRRGAWRLVEESHIECGALVKPFVVRTFHTAHVNLCQRILDGLPADAHTGSAHVGGGS